MGTNGGRRPYFPQDGPTEVVSHLNSNQVTADLNAVADFARKQTAICLCRPSVGLEELLFRDEPRGSATALRSEEHTSELQSPCNLVCRLLLEQKQRTRLH